LKQVSAFGYKQIESYEGKQGMLWGMTPPEFKQYMKELDMKIISSHCNINVDFEKKAADAASIGMKYLVCPYIGGQKTLDDYKRFADQFNKCGSICKKNGIRFAYHNHDYTFKEQDGQFPQDILMTETDPKLVDYEMDIFWVAVAGEDPIAWLKKYPGRFKLSHIKDHRTTDNGKDESCILGEGDIDYKGIAKIAEDYGIDYHVVEQEEYEGNNAVNKC
jgi:sugar phosphate isomerase/epimerase